MSKTENSHILQLDIDRFFEKKCLEKPVIFVLFIYRKLSLLFNIFTPMDFSNPKNNGFQQKKIKNKLWEQPKVKFRLEQTERGLFGISQKVVEVLRQL